MELQRLLTELRVSPSNAMALTILAEKFASRSAWRPYLDVLPATFHTPLFWSDAEMRELQNTSLAIFARQRQESVIYSAEVLQQQLRQHPLGKQLFPTGTFTLETFQWALSCVWSRSFRVRLQGRDGGAMVPLADMFNMGHPVKIREDGVDGITLTATHHIAAGEHIFVRYSTRPTMAQLVLDYGIMPEERSEFVHVAVVPALALRLSGAVVDVLDQLDLLPIHPFFYVPADEDAKELLIALRAEVIGDTNVLQLHSKNPKSLTYPLPDASQEAQVWLRLVDVLSTVLRNYPTTADEDEVLLQAAVGTRRTAIAMRLAEKRVLQSRLRVARAQVTRLTRMSETNAEL
eukprot:TRINITY_DN1758_c0_g1_i3.p1 TRINITY_DN1758_c0_g1~~TRINITY_DN1758_c0_g1_i3.p1  ORF type:complete len:347 (+),score=69.29 TRINITY_DN1758_c0_g1_i3:304-1344(+)